MPDLTGGTLEAELQGELESLGHYAAPVSGSPVHSLNLWLDDNDSRLPNATVVLDTARREFAWGHQFQHVRPFETPIDELALAVVRTAREDA